MGKKNFLGSEFLQAAAALSQGVLAGQPNATSSAAYANAQHTSQLASGMAQQEATEKARKKAKKAKKSALLGTIGTVLGTAIGGPVGGFIGGTAGNVIGGGSVGEAAIHNAVPLVAGKLGDFLIDKSTVDGFNMTAPSQVGAGALGASTGTKVTKPLLNKIGKKLKKFGPGDAESDPMYPYGMNTPFNPYGNY